MALCAVSSIYKIKFKCPVPDHYPLYRPVPHKNKDPLYVPSIDVQIMADEDLSQYLKFEFDDFLDDVELIRLG